MFGKKETDALVIGAGPVGLYTALSCARRGLKTQIIDEERRTAAHSYCLALHPSTLSLLNELGLADPLIERGRRIEKVTLYDGPVCRAEMSLAELGGDYPFVLSLPQSELEQVLEEELKNQKTKVDWNRRLSSLAADSSGIRVEIDKLDKVSSGYATAQTEWLVQNRSKLEPHFLVGADGHRSFVRRSLDFDYESLGTPVVFAVFECECETPLADELRVILADGVTSILWPLPEGRCRWSFEIPNGESPEEPRSKSRLTVRIGNETYWFLDEEHLQRFLQKRAPSFAPRCKNVRWSVLVQFESRLTSRFGRDLVWLAGDSAHQTGPAGMQSMNVALTEVNELLEILGGATAESDVHDKLEAYNEERSRVWRQLLGVEEGPTPGEGADLWVAEHAAKILPCVPASGADLRGLLGQVGLELAAADSPSQSS